MGDLFGSISDDADAMYSDRLYTIGGSSPTYGLVYANGWEPYTWVTRFDAVVDSNAHTVDAIFALDGGARAEVVLTEIELYEDEKERQQDEAASQYRAIL